MGPSARRPHANHALRRAIRQKPRYERAAKQDSAGAEVQCDQPAIILLELTCPVRHAGCTEQLLVCAEHNEWIAQHSFQLLVTMGLIVVKRVLL